MQILQNLTSIMVNIVTNFGAKNGTAPYTFSVIAGGAGGTIDPVSGVYTAPDNISSDPLKSFDTIKIVDALAVELTTTINICSPLGMICDIIRQEMELDTDQVHIYNQKFTIPNDSRIYISVSFLSEKAFATSFKSEEIAAVLKEIQTINLRSIVNIDIASKSMDANFRKEEAMMALTSNYSRTQQEANNFMIARIQGQMNDLSSIDGAAIPYRYNFVAPIQYSKIKVKSIQYYDTFDDVSIETEN